MPKKTFYGILFAAIIVIAVAGACLLALNQSTIPKPSLTNTTIPDYLTCTQDSDCLNTCCGCAKKCDIECFVLPARTCECKNNKCVEKITESLKGDFQDMAGVMNLVSCYCSQGGYLTTNEGKKVPVCYKEIQGGIACKKDVHLNGYFQTETITPSPMSACPPGSLNIFQATSYYCELPTN